MTDTEPQSVRLDLWRYLRVVRFFLGMIAHLLWWDILLRRLLGRRFAERSQTRRWQRMARRFRALAVKLGGVLIKLGQFLSVRVDVLPRVVTAELAGLQDEVPAERLDDIAAIVEAEYGQPLNRVFSWFAPEPDAAASLAQVHRARLLTGDEVVVKVQRPHIETIVETDLRAIRTATRWLKRYRPIRRRVDLDRLYAEFGRTTRAELDFVAEGKNAERFARDFAEDPVVRIPRIYAETSTRRVLIMENVASIKIGDLAALEAAGIDRKEVARRLFDVYLRQVFVHNFVHADPHPGNLFVEPRSARPLGCARDRRPDLVELDVSPPGPGPSAVLPSDSLRSASLGTGGTGGTGAGERVAGRKAFRLVFVDFGMVATVPERVRQHLRDYLIAFATRDAARMVRAYQGAGLLLPGADLGRLEQMEGELLERYSGLTLGEARQVLQDEWQSLAYEYRDILFEMPFQIPTDLLFVGRALAVLFGLATSLDPDFDPWEAIRPFATQMAVEDSRRDWHQWVGELEKVARLTLSLPVHADRFFARANQGELVVRSAWTPEATRTVRGVQVAVNRLAGAVIFAALLLAAVAVYVVQGESTAAYVLAGLAGVALLVTLTRR